MNKYWKEKWITALRSGNYSQGKYTLRDENNNFCCLGVLCDIKGVDWELGNNKYYANCGEEKSGYTLPIKIEQELKLYVKSQDVLGNMNDTGKTFNEIADWIQENE